MKCKCNHEMAHNYYGIDEVRRKRMKSEYAEDLGIKTGTTSRNDLISSHAVLGEGWRDVRKELPVTPFLAYWTDGRMTVLEEGDSVAYAIVGNPDKRVIGWIPLSEIGKPAFA